MPERNNNKRCLFCQFFQAEGDFGKEQLAIARMNLKYPSDAYNTVPIYGKCTAIAPQLSKLGTNVCDVFELEADIQSFIVASDVVRD